MEVLDVIRNVHERRLDAAPGEVGALLDSLAGADDRLWPHDRWAAMRFERPLDARASAEPLRVGASGGHGPIRYQVSRYVAGRVVAFSSCTASVACMAGTASRWCPRATARCCGTCWKPVRSARVG